MVSGECSLYFCGAVILNFLVFGGIDLICSFIQLFVKVCKATSLAYEGMAKKLKESHSSRVKFLSVDIDGKEGTNQLKESLNIKSVPMGLIYHPNVGAVGQVKLGRANLSELKKRLYRFLDADDETLDVALEGLLVKT